MDNLQSPAFPLEDKDYKEYGLTKLEYASLLIAQGLATLRDQHGQPYYSPDVLAIDSVKYAKSVLEESNK